MMNSFNDDTTDGAKRGPLKWEQSFRLMGLVKRNPSISAEELQLEGATIGIEISVRTAFRFLERYRRAGGDVFRRATSHLQMITTILEAAPPGQLLSPSEICEAALERGVSLHHSTVYRILHKLVATGTLVQEDVGSKTMYQWKREQSPHGRITCVSCGQSVEFAKDYLNSLAQTICTAFDFSYDHLELFIHARCKRCRG